MTDAPEKIFVAEDAWPKANPKGLAGRIGTTVRGQIVWRTTLDSVAAERDAPQKRADELEVRVLDLTRDPDKTVAALALKTKGPANDQT